MATLKEKLHEQNKSDYIDACRALADANWEAHLDSMAGCEIETVHLAEIAKQEKLIHHFEREIAHHVCFN